VKGKRFQKIGNDFEQEALKRIGLSPADDHQIQPKIFKVSDGN
jgi:hypothetical protein